MNHPFHITVDKFTQPNDNTGRNKIIYSNIWIKYSQKTSQFLVNVLFFSLPYKEWLGFNIVRILLPWMLWARKSGKDTNRWSRSREFVRFFHVGFAIVSSKQGNFGNRDFGNKMVFFCLSTELMSYTFSAYFANTAVTIAARQCEPTKKTCVHWLLTLPITPKVISP